MSQVDDAQGSATGGRVGVCFGSRGVWRGRGGMYVGRGSIVGPSHSVSQCDSPGSNAALTGYAEGTSFLAAEFAALKLGVEEIRAMIIAMQLVMLLIHLGLHWLRPTTETRQTKEIKLLIMAKH